MGIISKETLYFRYCLSDNFIVGDGIEIGATPIEIYNKASIRYLAQPGMDKLKSQLS